MNKLESAERNINVFDFEPYRDYCDAVTVGARKLGLLDKELALKAISDPRSIVVENQGHIIPAFVPFEYAAGYDQERSMKIVEDKGVPYEGIFYFCLPPSNIPEDQLGNVSKALAGKNVAIFFDHSQNDRQTETIIAKVVQDAMLYYQEAGLIDKRTGNDSKASISLYTTKANLTDRPDIPIQLSFSSAYNYFVAAGKNQKYPRRGVSVFSGSEISNHRELQEQIWQLYQSRFQWLGEEHPLSMEDAEEEFFGQIQNPNTEIFVNFSEGKIVGVMDTMTRPEDIYWLNPGFFENLTLEENRKILFIPGIVADPRHLGQSGPLITKLCEMASCTGNDYKIIFENTNLSELYVPKLGHRFANRSGNYELSFPAVEDRHFYRLIHTAPRP